MRVPVSWLAELVPAAHGRQPAELAERLTRAGFEVEGLETVGAAVSGVVVGRVLSLTPEPQKNGKTIRWCQVDVGEPEPRGIVCGAGNFAEGDLVAAALPGAVLPGGFEIAARKTYGHVSDGMLCSARELGLGDDHDGILILQGAQVGEDAGAALGLRAESVLDLAITPDRGYALSLRGIARELAIALEVAFADPAAAEVSTAAGAAPPVHVIDAEGCRRYLLRRVAGLGAGTLPDAERRRLELAGMRSISLAVDVTNYVMLLLGQPLHAFDAATVRGTVQVRRAAPGEALRTLDGVDRALDSEDLVIADDEGPIALAGVMGGERTEVTAATTDVLIEAAHFDPVAVTRSARRHGLPSEASRRFERFVDPALPPVAASLAVRLLEQHGGAHAEGATSDSTTDLPTRVLSLPVEAAARKAGRSYDRHVVVTRLQQIGCRVADTGRDRLEVVPPTWRPDLAGEAELTEEIIRLEGYETLPSVLPRAVPGRGLTAGQRGRRAVGRALAHAGLVEVVIPPFLGARDLVTLGLGAEDERNHATRVHNAMSEDAALLRTTLLPGLFAAAARNAGRGTRDLALYEMGLVFLPGAQPLPVAPVLPVDRAPAPAELAALEAALPHQPWHAAGVFTGQQQVAAWNAASRPADWTDAVAAAQSAVGALRLEAEVTAATAAPWHPGRCAQLRVGGTTVGHAGEVHPVVCRAVGLPERTSAFEIDVSRLLDLARSVHISAPSLSSFPPVARDVALLVPVDVPAAAVEAALRQGAGELVESVRLFDAYVGDQVAAGEVSLAYRMVLRASDRTLRDEEANAARDAAVAATAEVGARLRT